MTLAELRAAQSTVDGRLVAAVLAGDADQVAAIEAERAALPVRLFAAEVATLQADIVRARLDLEAAKVAERQAGIPGQELRAQLLDVQRRIRLTDRDHGLAANHLDACRTDLRRLEERLEALVAEQSHRAQVAVAPVMHSLWHARPPQPR